MLSESCCLFVLVINTWLIKKKNKYELLTIKKFPTITNSFALGN